MISILLQAATKDSCSHAAGVDCRKAPPAGRGENHTQDCLSFYFVLIHSHLFFRLQYLDCLWAQVQKLKKDRWQERHILRPYIAFDSVLCEALQHNLPPFTPPAHSEDAVYPMPRVVFRIFDYTDAPEVREDAVTFVFRCRTQ